MSSRTVRVPLLLLLSMALSSPGTNAQECGVAPLNTRIVGGGGAAAGSWPWMVSIHRGGSHICGGTVISSQWVLTAAHCIPSLSVIGYTLYLGRDTQAGPNANEVSRSLSRIIVHPNYNDTFFNNDIALMELSSPVAFTDYIRPACLASSSSAFHNGTSCWATGWGATEKDEPLPASSSLQEVQIPIIGNRECTCTYTRVSEANITANMVCAGQLNRGACQGDSGGPLQCQQGSVWIQAGLTSFGVPCAVGFPEVYARVSEFQAWITAQVAGANVTFVAFRSNGTDPDSTLVCRNTGRQNSGKLATELVFVALMVILLQEKISAP